MKFVNSFRGFLLTLRAVRCQRRKRYNEELALLLEARRLAPQSDLVLMLLGDALRRAKRYADAREAVGSALQLNPGGYLLNRLMVDILIDSGAPVQEITPHIKTVLRNRAGGTVSTWPLNQWKWLKEVKQRRSEWEAWAEKTLLDSETGRL